MATTDEHNLEPIDFPFVEAVQPIRYKCFKYKTKKPGNIVSNYIKHYTDEEDIVLDPFCGSGIVAVEALRNGRKVIAMDINPVATFITKNLTKPADIGKFKIAFTKTRKRVRDEILALYHTKCRRCRRDAVLICSTCNRDAEEPQNQLIDVRYHCKKCGKTRIDAPTKKDVQILIEIKRRVSEGEIPWYPNTKLRYANGKEFKEGTHLEGFDSVPKLFTERNLLALALLNEEIGRIKDEEIKELMQFTFMTMIHLASKLCPVRKTRPLSSHWGRDTRFWIPRIFMEQNVWTLFRRAFNGKQSVLKAKEDTNKEISSFRSAENFEDLEDGANILIKTASVFDLDNIIPKEKVAFVFTDPPYGGAIQHGELSTIWSSWLRFERNFDEELTINEQQGKDFEYYHNMMHAAFRKIFAVVKPEGFVVVTFHNTNTRVFNSAIKAPRYSGFNLVSSPIYQVGRRPSVKALTQPFGSAEGDYYLNFQKPRFPQEMKEIDVSKERQKRIIIDAAKKIIGRRGEPTSFTDILRGIHRELSFYGYYPITEEDARKVLRKQSGEEFVPVQVKDNAGKIVGSLWWLKDPSSIEHLERIPLAERVETAVLRILRREFKVTFGEVLQEIFKTYTNALTPSPSSIRRVLEEYGKKLKGGEWSLKPTVKVREQEHSRMIGLLSEIGQKAGFKVWIGLEEQSKGYYGKIPLSSLSEQKLDIPTDQVSLRNIQQIDVIWFENGKAHYIFEVEHTTQITSAIVRGSYLPPDSIKRFIVIPTEREALMHKRVNAPIIKERIEDYNWGFIFYKDLETFYEENKRKDRIQVKEFNELRNQLLPLNERRTQLTIPQFK